MKGKLVLLTVTLFFGLGTLLGPEVYAQEALRPRNSSNFARNSIFLELGGNGILYSLNYDHKFFDHASARIGGMYFSVSADDPNTIDGRVSVFFVPIMANYLLGNGNSRLEIGGGLAIAGVSGDATVDNEAINDVGSGVAFTGTIGYRLQPRDGGFLFRIGFTPIFAPGAFLPWAGLSFGATF